MLLDHFHPPLSLEMGWEGYHSQWASVLVADLNSPLPAGWRAYSEVELGIEIDVGVTTRETSGPWQEQQTLREPTMTIPFVPPTDRIEILVVNRSYTPSVVGAIELVSPANDDRPDHRKAFATKCQSILFEGAGLVVVDIVTERRSNLHVALMERLQHPDRIEAPDLYATAYRPVRVPESEENELQIWVEPLAIGSPLPSLPLYLRVGPMMLIDLDATYRTTCQQLRIPLEQPLPQSH